MAFEINLPRRIDAGVLRRAGMVVEVYIERSMSTAIEEVPVPFEVHLPYFLSETPVSITVIVLQMKDVVRLRIAAPETVIEQSVRDYLKRYSAENHGEGIEALMKLRATQYVEEIRGFLRDPDPDIRRQAKRALNNLGFPVSTAPKPVHLVKKPKIPGDLTEWSVALGMDDIGPTLQKLATCVESGFGSQEVSEVIGTVEKMRPDQTRTFRFPITADGRESSLWLVLFLDDVDSPDLAVHTSAAVAERFRSTVAES